MIPRRQHRLRGRHALVDGIPFELPVNSKRSPALMAAFSCDLGAARDLIPSHEVHPLVLPNGRAVLFITVIDYRETDIGKYIEYSIAIPCTHGRRPAPLLLGAIFQRRYGTGQFVVDLPVSTEISVKGGKGIWGMPKHRANLDFVIGEDTISSQYDLDGQLCTRIEIDRPRLLRRLPLSAGAVNYCAFRGLLMKSAIYFKGRIDVALGPMANARFLVGDHPRVAALKGLDLSSRALFTAFIPESEGVLDDHFEGWIISYPEPPAERPEGLESVTDLGLGEEWLPAPHAGRAMSDFLAALNAGVLMCWVSIYFGTGVSLVLFQFPTAKTLTPANYYTHIVPQVEAATTFFTRMTQIMFVNGALMVWSEWGSWWILVPIGVLLLVVLSTGLTIRYIFPYNKRLEEGITDAAELRSQLARWMRLNRLRSTLWALEWLVMIIWFVGKAS